MHPILLRLPLLLLLPLLTQASNLLRNGPMVGYATMGEVLIWVQTASPAEVVVQYWEAGNPNPKWKTHPITTSHDDAFVAKCIADQVQSGTRYHYQVQINGEPHAPSFRDGYSQQGNIPLSFQTPPNWRFRENGHAPVDFTIAFGSCAYINQPGPNSPDRLNSSPYGADYHIFESIYEKSPDVFLWLGDNIYYRENDWTSWTGMVHRWTHDRSTPELRPLLANTVQYATWDDHDYGPNDAGREFWNKAAATRAFQLFNGNPTAGLPELPGIFTFFNWCDVNVYLLDNRTYRNARYVDATPFGEPRALLGKAQIDWLVESLQFAQGQSARGGSPSYPVNFHLIAIGNQVFSPGSLDSYRHYPEEFNYLLDRITSAGIDGVVFLSGDVHHSEVSRFTHTANGKTQTYYEITSSPLTAGPWAGPDASINPHRYDIFDGEPDRVGQRNFATLTFSGPLNDRSLTIRYFDANGNLLNQAPQAEPGKTTPASTIKSIRSKP